MKKLLTCIIVLVMLLFGCSPKLLQPKELPDLKFEKTQLYSLDISTIPKPDKIVPIYVDDNYNLVDVENARYIILTSVEYAKIAGLLKLAIAYKNIAKEQEILINSNIEIINSLKEYVALERMKAQEYRNLWIDSENAYREERYSKKWNDFINKGTMSIISIGAIVLAILAL